MFKVLFLSCAFAMAMGRPGAFDLDDDHSSEEYGVYHYQYAIDDPHSGNHFGHSESRNGGHRTEGRYYVRLPDTRLMVVEYYADATGYHPTITFEGEAQYPSPQAHSEQSFDSNYSDQQPQSHSEQSFDSNYSYQQPQDNFAHEESHVEHETHNEPIIETQPEEIHHDEHHETVEHVQHTVEEPSPLYEAPRQSDVVHSEPNQEFNAPTYS